MQCREANRNDILKLAGERCERLLTEQIHNVRVSDPELDEVWTFVGCEQKRLTLQRVEKGMAGDAYTFIALETSSKLVSAWHLGKRDRVNMEDSVFEDPLGNRTRFGSMSVPVRFSRMRAPLTLLV
jgi:hypothetical protein